jgi:DNA-binding GntR family transcriptional regulator
MPRPLVSGDLNGALERSTLGSQISDILRSDIVFGRLKTGTKLTQQEVCERFSTSRMPARDALRQLVSEGFLVDEGVGRCRVVQLSAQDIEDTYVLAGMLHGFAARRVAQTATKETIQQLQRAHEKMAGLLEDPESYNDVNTDFHREIVEASHSPKIVAALRSVALAVPSQFLMEFPDLFSHSILDRVQAEHARLIKAVANGRASSAEKIARDHLTWVGPRVVEYLRSRKVDVAD